MSHNVERRAVEAEVGSVPAGPTVLEEPSRMRLAPESTGSKRHDDGLTRRERRVKDMLLRELKKYSDSRLLTYQEIQNLEKELNVTWIDEQLEQMQRTLRTVPWFIRLASLAYGLMAVQAYMDAAGAGGQAIAGAWFALALLAGVFAPYWTQRSLRRKIFIYEALRELAGADEAGITLDRAVRDADKLITRIVDMELAAEHRLPAKSIGRKRVH